jgi:hypothetical protein
MVTMASQTRRIFALASLVEPDREAVWRWFYHERLPVADGQTPCDLLFTGQGAWLETWLEGVIAADTDLSNVRPLVAEPRRRITMRSSV